jgi:hypothetical protein
LNQPTNRHIELDQYYTTSSVIAQFVMPIITTFMSMGGTFVDFSCGDNEVGRLLKESGRARHVLAYDLAPTLNATASGAVRKNWFDVTSLPSDACVGLNPPFGKGGRLAQRFITHTLSIGEPKFFFLILPVRESWHVPGYVQERCIRLPIDAFQLSDGTSFSYPSRLHVFRRAPHSALTIAAQLSPPTSLPAGCNMRTNTQLGASCLESNRMTLFVRRVGSYAGYQLYFVVNRSTIFYFDKRNLHRQTWKQLRHLGATTFTTVTLPLPLLKGASNNHQMRFFEKVSRRMVHHVTLQSLTTPAEDCFRTRSVNRARIAGMIRAGFAL